MPADRRSRTIVAAVLVLAAVASAHLQTPATPQAPLPLEAPRPIDAGNSLWTEELTWMEVRDRRADTRNGMHDDIYYEAQAAVQDPKLIRAEQRLEAGLFTPHGVDLAPVSKTMELGRALAVYRAGITARAF